MQKKASILIDVALGVLVLMKIFSMACTPDPKDKSPQAQEQRELPSKL